MKILKYIPPNYTNQSIDDWWNYNFNIKDPVKYSEREERK